MGDPSEREMRGWIEKRGSERHTWKKKWKIQGHCNQNSGYHENC